MFFPVSLLLLCVGIAASASFSCNVIPGKLRQIDAGSGKVYGVNSNDDIFRRVGNDWKPLPGKLIHVSVGPAGVWGVNRANQIFKFQNNDWIYVSGSLKQIDSGGNKYLGGVNGQDNIFCSRQNSADSAVSWTSLDGSLKYYSCGKWGCWGVNSAKNVFFRQGVTSTSCQGTQWQSIEGNLEMIEVGTDGSVYGVNSAGNAYRRNGINGRTPTGTSWTQLDLGYTFKHVTYADNYLWLITPTDDIVRCAVSK